MRFVLFRCYRFTRSVTNEELLVALEKRLSTGAVRQNVCSQEFLWVQQQTVQLLLVRQDHYFAWVPLAMESAVCVLGHSWWQPMRLQASMPLRSL